MADEQVPSPKVAVGVDGSSTARAALEWAAAEAEREDLPLYLVHALAMPLVLSLYSGPTRFPPPEEASEYGRRFLAEAADHARELRPGLRVETVLAPEEAPLALLHRTGPGDLVVVGSRGLSPLNSALAGSAGVRLASQATCPVVVVPPAASATPPPTESKRIVVGVDDSEDARRALDFALHRAARLEGASVVVVNSWEVPLPFTPESLMAAGWTPPDDLLDRRSEELVSRVLAEVMDDATQDVDVTVVRTERPPVEALVEAGAEADLIVVGSRGRGSVRGLLLGSVSQGVLHNATVPVMVLPKGTDTAG